MKAPAIKAPSAISRREKIIAQMMSIKMPIQKRMSFSSLSCHGIMMVRRFGYHTNTARKALKPNQHKIKNTKRYTRLLPTSRALWLCKNAPTMVSRTIEITSAKIATSIAVLSHSQFLPNSLNKIDKSPTLITGKMMINTGETPKI